VPPLLARQSSSKICSVFVYGKYSLLPRRSAMSSRISQSRRASPGGSTAALI
jgi:hypothetical protein